MECPFDEQRSWMTEEQFFAGLGVVQVSYFWGAPVLASYPRGRGNGAVQG